MVTRIAAAAAQHAGTIAIDQPGHGTVTHGELDARSNRLAHFLRQRGVGRGDLVGLCVDRGIDMVVAQLGILKAGAAYVPLDPALPGRPPRLHGRGRAPRAARHRVGAGEFDRLAPRASPC